MDEKANKTDETTSEISSTISNESSLSKQARLGLDKELLLDNYFAKPLSDKQNKKLEQLFLKTTVSYMQTDQLGVTLTYDSWKNIKKKSLLGIALINSKGKILIWKNKIRVNCLITDSASEFMAAQLRLRTSYSDKVFISCFAHQMNLAIGDIFRYSSTFKTIAKKAISLNLTNKIDEGLDTSLVGFLEDILVNILDNSWWFDLQELEALLLSYCLVLNKLQCDHSRLHEVLHSFRWIVQEQLLLLLSFLLHSEYHDNIFNKQIPNLTFLHLGIHESKKKFTQIQIATSAMLSNKNSNRNDGMIQESENEDTELEETQQSEKNNEIKAVNDWNSLVEEKEEMILESNHSDNPDKKNEELTEFSFENKHPAIVSNAK
ncbi:21600_t:CDS:2 [Cetraspora pellucida]|uniref:21600_t:CDS:1 n=1 Tax=Cetraspora pellucida TaxID=1433469 RepID=A0A9N9HL15_9GLOM|nr:21600_t:CDS:2 [Cetraspora pellucida]